jgi:hypothetical protein
MLSLNRLRLGVGLRCLHVKNRLFNNARKPDFAYHQKGLPHSYQVKLQAFPCLENPLAYRAQQAPVLLGVQKVVSLRTLLRIHFKRHAASSLLVEPWPEPS